uniref:Uncharacterized protein n=1 Tax=Oryza glumipatula TaxID=40148 RepID=A0A0E0BUP3_9ORYZ
MLREIVKVARHVVFVTRMKPSNICSFSVAYLACNLVVITTFFMMITVHVVLDTSYYENI